MLDEKDIKKWARGRANRVAFDIVTDLGDEVFERDLTEDEWQEAEMIIENDLEMAIHAAVSHIKALEEL